MITTSMKRKFLVIGITGPLRSGCTTAANFFANKLASAAKLYSGQSEQQNIEAAYHKIAELLAKDEPNIKELEQEKSSLSDLLRSREIKKILSKANIPTFQYISMSNILLKYCAEYLLLNGNKPIDKKYERFAEIIRQQEFNNDLIRNINQTIEQKRYRELLPRDCQTYDKYLTQISELMTFVRDKLTGEDIGDILQDLGDNIRKHGNPFQSSGGTNGDFVYSLADEANKLIKYYRNRPGKENKRHHFVIECFRNPFEVDYFRYRYYEFYLLSIFADQNLRQGRGKFSKERDERDRGKDIEVNEIYKQNVSRCVYLADIAINNDSSEDAYYHKLLKYYSLILSPGCVAPTSQEVFMNQAYSLSLKSSCISHQVGAVIIGKNGYVVGAGWNDVGEGQIGCGYRQLIDIDALPNSILPTNPEENKVFREKLVALIAGGRNNDESFCYKDEFSAYKVEGKIDSFIETHMADLAEDRRKLIKEWLIKDIKIKRLEYCRALHAEENALLQSAKIGGMGVRGGTIYTTYFPCELCAKKIYQTGLKEIIYTEPYPESVSQDVFLKDGIIKIKVTQFEGVKSHSYFRLFKAALDKKEAQQMPGL